MSDARFVLREVKGLPCTTRIRHTGMTGIYSPLAEELYLHTISNSISSRLD
jgi:hypothetical protein